MNTHHANPFRLRIPARSVQLQGTRWGQDDLGRFRAAAISAAASAALPLIEPPQAIAEPALHEAARAVQAPSVEAAA